MILKMSTSNFTQFYEGLTPAPGPRDPRPCSPTVHGKQKFNFLQLVHVIPHSKCNSMLIIIYENTFCLKLTVI